MSDHKQDLRTFEEWFSSCDGTKKEAEKRQRKVDESLKNSWGQVSYLSEVVDRYGDGKYWVHVKRVIDYNHPDRIARGL